MRIQPQRLQRRLIRLDPDTEPLAVKANTSFPGCPSCDNTAGRRDEIRRTRQHQCLVGLHRIGIAVVADQAHQVESMLIGTGRPAPAEDGDPGLRVADCFSHPTQVTGFADVSMKFSFPDG